MRRLGAALVLLLCITLVGACSRGKQPEAAPPTTVAAEPATSLGAPAAEPGSESLSYVAQAEVPAVPVFDAPEAAQPSQTLRNPNPTYGTPRVFLIDEERGDWLKVLLPTRPNGSTGWIRKRDVSIVHHDYRMVLELRAHKLTVYKGKDVFFEGPVGLGASATPTPTGLFYTTELLIPPPDQPYYGTYAYGLSAHSEVLDDFLGGDGQVGIHGTNDPSSVGANVSNGCIRMYNENITQLAENLPIGVPVEIKA